MSIINSEKSKPTESSFSERFLEAFRPLGWNQKKIAEILDLSEATITDYAARNRIPPGKTLLRIYELTNCSLHWLLTGEGPETPSLVRVQNRDVLKIQFSEEIRRLIEELANRDGASLEQKTIELVLSSLAVCSMQINEIFDEDKRRQLLLDLLDMSQAKKEKTVRKRGRARKAKR
jgi:transcriptional regulator with XRE-family HTH domain